MLDKKFIVENIELIKQNCQNRGVAAIDFDRLLQLESDRKAKRIELDEANRLANEKSKAIGPAPPEEREAIKEEARALREKKSVLDAEVHEIEAALKKVAIQIPNMSHPDAPIGKDDKANLEIRKGKTEPRTFDFEVKDHLVIGQEKDWIDFEGGARTTGSGFYFLKNDLVLLELALQQYAIQELVKRGFTPMITPDLAHNGILEGIGFNPRGPETQVYSIENTDLSLVGTAEITLGGYYSDQTLNAEDLPIKLCGISHCYRTEAGAAGRASRGLYRVHQFTKVEMFAYAMPDKSDELLEELCQIECDLFDGLGVPYRVVDTATGDLGGPAYRKYDLEAWMPGRGEAGEWGEVTSTSNCTDYQARRLNIRYKQKGEKGTKFPHTLNGTAIALSRGIIAVLENYQQADGTVVVPDVLRPFMGKDVIG